MAEDFWGEYEEEQEKLGIQAQREKEEEQKRKEEEQKQKDLLEKFHQEAQKARKKPSVKFQLGSYPEEEEESAKKLNQNEKSHPRQ